MIEALITQLGISGASDQDSLNEINSLVRLCVFEAQKQADNSFELVQTQAATELVKGRLSSIGTQVIITPNK